MNSAPQSGPTIPPRPVTAAPTPIPNPKSKIDILHAFCMAVQVYEGYIIPGGKDGSGIVYQSGSPAYRNKNPGNLRCNSRDRTNWNMLATGCTADNFCTFPTYEIGFTALVNVTLSVARGKSPTYNAAAEKLGLDNCAQMSLTQYFLTRDPSSDGNFPENFARFVARTIGVDIVSFRMKDLIG